MENQAKLEKDTAKKEAKAVAKAEAAQKKKMVRSPYAFSSRFPVMADTGIRNRK